MSMQPIVTKTIDMGEGKKILVEDLSPEIQQMVILFDKWKNDHRDLQLESHKVALALEGIQAQISSKVTSFLAPDEKEGVSEVEVAQ